MRRFFYLLVSLTFICFTQFVSSERLSYQFAHSASWLRPPYYGTEICTQGLGYNPSLGYYHDGYDFNLQYEPVLAVADGTITKLQWADLTCHNSTTTSCALGLHITITHSNGYTSSYGHLSSAIGMVGQVVKQGQMIGTSGNSGFSTVPHLHFSMRTSSNGVFDPGSLIWNGTIVCNGTVAPQPQVVVPKPIYYQNYLLDNDIVPAPGYYQYFNAVCWGPSSCSGWNIAAIGYYGYMHWNYVGDANASLGDLAYWQPNNGLLKIGIYDVRVYIPNDHATSYQAKYQIVGSNGQTNQALVDQLTLSDQWVSIGTYGFTPNGPRVVYLRDDTGEPLNSNGSRRKVGADAVQFVMTNLGKDFLPLILR
jgi:hypothetical protein